MRLRRNEGRVCDGGPSEDSPPRGYPSPPSLVSSAYAGYPPDKVSNNTSMKLNKVSYSTESRSTGVERDSVE